MEINMNRQASLMRVFQMLKEGLPLEEIKAQNASPDAETMENIATSVNYIDALMEQSASLDVPQEIKEKSSYAHGSFRQWIQLQANSEPDIDIGQIWTVDLPDAPQLHLAALLDLPTDPNDETVTIAPVSLETGFAAEEDLIVDCEESPLGYSFMVESWHYGSVASDRLVEYQSALNKELTDYLIVLYSHCRTHEPLADLCAVIGTDCEQLQARVGEPLEQQDVRNSFRAQEMSLYTSLWKTGVDKIVSQEMPGSKSCVFGELKPSQLDTLSTIREQVIEFYLEAESALAASSESRQNVRLAADFKGKKNVVELGYSRRSGDLYLYFEQMSDELAHKAATIWVCINDNDTCKSLRTEVPGSAGERLTLASKGEIKAEDVKHLKMIVAE
jgi:hypothetical protein